MSHYVYILQSITDEKYYIGQTNNVEARLTYHNAGLQRSTKSRVPFKLVLFEVFSTRKDALKREKQIKAWKGGEAFKRLIAGR